jgi:phosphatidylinositol alpha-mannosyltransferase
MKIAITHPFCWPSVRRGSEFMMDTLARYLVSRQHEVVTVSTDPEGPKDEQGPGGRRILHSPAWHPLLGRLRVQPTHTFMPNCARTLLSLDLDVVVSFFYSDGFAAQLAARRRGFKTIQQMNGVPVPHAFHRRFPPDRAMIRSVLRNADCRIVCSQFVADLVDHYYGVEVEVLHVGQALDDFAVGNGPPDGRPTILGVANFEVRHKGVRTLVRAFQLVHDKEPEARLRLSGHITPETEREILSLVSERTRGAIEILGLGRPEDLPRQYREASIMALPSMWEPSGNVMCEAWASGTPVVATRHGGLPEFFAEGVGYLFDPETDGEETPNIEGLADALLRGLRLSEQEGVRERCRAHVEQWSWNAVGPRYEELYAE